MTNSTKIAKHPDTIHSITFRESDHSYIDNVGSRYVSCTTFFKPFFPVFKTIKISEACSIGDNPKYAGRKPEEIREEWLKESRRGSSEGNNVHEYAEIFISHPSAWAFALAPSPISIRCESLFNQVEIACKKLLSRFEFIEAEKIVFSPDLGISGTIDLLMYDPAANEIIIIDWKQNKNPLSTENIYRNCLNPIEHLQDTDINKYSLQLSMYQYLLERENYYPAVKGYRRVLIHLTVEKATPIKLDYYDYEINELLTINKGD